MNTTQLQTPEFIPVNAQLLAAVHNYLITRPYQEVVQFVPALMKAAQDSIQQHPPETTDATTPAENP